MPLLGGLFSRKHKSSPRLKHDDQASTSIYSTELDSNISSPTTSYITPDRSIPSHPNGNLLPPTPAGGRRSFDVRAPAMSPNPTPSSGHKLRLFGRKKSTIAGQELTAASAPDVTSQSYTTPPRPAQQIRGASEAFTAETDPRRLRPPPSRSAIFAAYGDPSGALSTRSLPNDSSLTVSDVSHSPPTPSSPVQKRPSLFPWAKPTASTSSSPKSPYQDSPKLNEGAESPISPDGSFNLKSFRHIRPPSPTNGSSTSLSAPIPRPRGASVNSEASQRISVAAFREAQARRSQAGSPSPDFRSPSPAPALPSQPDGSRGGNSSPRLPQNVAQRRRRSSMAIASTTESDEEDSSDEEESEDEARYTVGRNRTGKVKAKSEIGHGASESAFKRTIPPLPTRTPRSHSGHTVTPSPRPLTQFTLKDEEKKTEQPARSQSILGIYDGSRPRASVSTSALSPSAAAKRASVLAASNADLSKLATDSAPSLRQLSNGSPSSQTKPQAPFRGQAASQLGHGSARGSQIDSDSDSEDNAPLATLVGPRRPGSAMSSYSNSAARSTGNVTTRSATNPKPLIDINELTGPPKRSYTTPAEQNNAGFTQGRTLLSGAKPMARGSSRLVESPTAMSGSDDYLPLTRIVAPVKFVSPPSTPAKELEQFIPIERKPTVEPPKPIPLPEPVAAVTPAPARRETSPEQRRDTLNDRLSRAVKLNMGSNSSSPSSSAVVQNNFVSRDVSPRPGDASDSSRSRPRSSIEIPQAAARLPKSPPPDVAPHLDSVLESSRTRSSNDASRTAVRQQHRSPLPDFAARPDSFSETSQRRLSNDAPRVAAQQPRSPPPVRSIPENHSPVDEDLAELLGSAGIRFISRSGETPEESSESESDESEEQAPKPANNTDDRIAPIAIKQRSPPPAFSVTSRPAFPKHPNGSTPESEEKKKASSSAAPRQRSSTLITSSSSTFKPSPSASTMSSYATAQTHVASKSVTQTQVSQVGGNTNTTTLTKTEQRSTTVRPTPTPTPAVRQRSSTMLTGVPLSSQMPKTFHLPEKPFAARRESPASSTGGSSSGMAPLTPRDGSDLSVPTPEDVSEKKQDFKRQHIKRRSVSFEDDVQDLKPPSRSHFREGARTGSDGGNSSNDEDRVEFRRRERRRSEARAAIELGNVINGPGPVVDDDDDDLPINHTMNARMSTMNPMMGMTNSMSMPMGFSGSPGPGWGGGNMGQQMLSPAQFMMPPPADPNFIAAHQQAMMIAKQAYQMAVAQQAMAAAADEWERGSAIGGYGGGGSVYGGSSQSMMGSPYGMMGMMQGGGGWSGGGGSVYGGGGGARSMYGASLGPGDGMMSSSRSEYGGMGGGRGGGNWNSSRSTYGESFGPSSDPHIRKSGYGQPSSRTPNRNVDSSRDSGYFPPVPPLPASRDQSGRSSPDMRAAASRSRTTSQPASPGRGGVVRKAPPPSSWKINGGV